MRALVAVVAVGALALAGCTGGSDGGRVTVTASYASPSEGATIVRSSAPPPTPATGSPSGSPTATASIAQPPEPVVTAGNAGAWTLTRAARAGSESGQVAALHCGQDGSVVADGLVLAPGASALSLGGDRVTGTSENDAAGGTFRGRDADTAITFTWTC